MMRLARRPAHLATAVLIALKPLPRPTRPRRPRATPEQAVPLLGGSLQLRPWACRLRLGYLTSGTGLRSAQERISIEALLRHGPLGGGFRPAQQAVPLLGADRALPHRFAN